LDYGLFFSIIFVGVLGLEGFLTKCFLFYIFNLVDENVALCYSLIHIQKRVCELDYKRGIVWIILFG